MVVPCFAFFPFSEVAQRTVELVTEDPQNHRRASRELLAYDTARHNMDCLTIWSLITSKWVALIVANEKLFIKMVTLCERLRRVYRYMPWLIACRLQGPLVTTLYYIITWCVYAPRLTRVDPVQLIYMSVSSMSLSTNISYWIFLQSSTHVTHRIYRNYIIV